MTDAQMSTKQTAAFFANALKAFSASQDAFRVLSTMPRARAAEPSRPPDSLVILDSSFNPPTRAHGQMAASAMRQVGPGARLVLLLAVTNADKDLVPAPLETRLGMMEGLGRELLRDLGPALPLRIDVAVTRMPYFHAKSAAVAAAGVYGGAEQVFLCGFDTVVRILDPKYYGDGMGMGMSAALGPFFRRARLRVTMRPDGGWGSGDEQAAYVRGLEGGHGEWARRIELVEGVGGAVSSSRVRELVRRLGGGDEVVGGLDGLDGLVGAEVARWIDEQGLYRE